MVKIIQYNKFLDVDIRVGTIIKAEINDILKKPSIVLQIDFGNEIGIKKSLAQLTSNYVPDKIINKQIAAVVNFNPKQIGNMISEVLVLGFPDDNDEPVLISPDTRINNGARLY